uniref:Uncharacterized protein n=3 Tax=Aegilops tauschii subsp. strangulata TaxID=200361 RepID=A0A452Y8F7_AEGTS
CSYRRQKNCIHSLVIDGHTISDQAEVAKAAFMHFDRLIGTTTDRECTFNLSQLITLAEDLVELEAAFEEDEIWQAIKQLPAHQAPGPYGFTTEFLRACWGTVKQDFIAVFQQLFALRGRGFHRLNQALLKLLPQRPDAQGIGDYCAH